MRKLTLVAMSIFFWTVSCAQSLEVMPDVERVFIDAQYLKFIDKNDKFSLFSRSRATAEYNEQATNLFTGAYFNYTTKSGFGGTVLGRISTNSSGIDAGAHYFKAKKTFMIYALSSINVNDELLYSWFSIMRYTPKLKEGLKLYCSLELFSAFGEVGHLNSVQRVRLGVEKKGFQFGPAINLNKSRSSNMDLNPGIFFRKQFE